MDAAPRAISVVIPAYNEEAGVGRALTDAVRCLRADFARFEVLLVDDGSTDATACVALGLRFPEVRVVRHAKNHGYGAALRTGFEVARFPLVAFTDADGQFDLSELKWLADDAAHAEVAVGYRADRQDPKLRCFLAWGYNLLIRAMLGSRVRDVDCALKVFRREALSMILPRTRRFLVNAEMLTYARRRGLRVSERPVTHRPRLAGVSRVGWRDVPRTFLMLLAFWLWHVVLNRGPVTAGLPTALGPVPVPPRAWPRRRRVVPTAPEEVRA